ASLALTAVMLSVPMAYEAVKLAGAAYLLWMAWSSVRPGAGSALQPRRDLKVDRPARLFAMGFLTSLLHPKLAIFYVSLLPPLRDPDRGRWLGQSLWLGAPQVAISFTVNLLIVLAAGGIASWFAARPTWLQVQRWVMGRLLASLRVTPVLHHAP